MKALYAFLLLILCLSVPAFGQLPLRFGACAGMSSANQNYKNNLTGASGYFDSKLGLRIGAFAEYITSPFLSFTGDISYMQNGTKDKELLVVKKADNQYGFIEMPFDFRYDYISFSPMVKCRLEAASLMPSISLGPSFSYLIGGNEQANISSGVFKKLVLGYTACLGTEFRTGLPFSVIAEIRYNQDLTNARSNDDWKVINHSFAFLAGVKF